MDDALLVGELQTLDRLQRDLDCSFHGHPMVGRFLDQALDVATAHQLGDDEGLGPISVRQRLRPEIEDRHDIGGECPGAPSPGLPG